MVFPDTLTDWLRDNHFGKIVRYESLSGGCINQCFRLHCKPDKTFFLKTHNNPPINFYAAEATGLKALSNTKSLRIPQVYYYQDNFLLLEYLPSSPQKNNYWETLGNGLAELHLQTTDHFGFTGDNYCGITPQPNSIESDGFHFFAEQRLLYQSKLATQQNLLEKRDFKAIESICLRLKDLIPKQAPALIHGDLWSGNIHTDSSGEPVLIDPACYWGWAEAELAMTQLFGGFDQRFYQHYWEINAFESGFENRVDLYNLYHMLNHLNIFGGSYYQSVKSIINKYR